MRTKGAPSAVPPHFARNSVRALPGPSSRRRANGRTRAVLLSGELISSAISPNDFGQAWAVEAFSRGLLLWQRSAVLLLLAPPRGEVQVIEEL